MTRIERGTAEHFFSNDLLSKWGFSDGELLNDLVYAWQRLTGRSVDPHDVLVECVRRFVLPTLDQRVELEVVSTIHNPARAARVDGAVVGDEMYDPAQRRFHLTPELVVVSNNQILRVADDLAVPDEEGTRDG